MQRLYNNLHKKPFEKGSKVTLIKLEGDLQEFHETFIPGNIFTVDQIGGNILSLEEFPDSYFHKKLFTYAEESNLSINIEEGIERVVHKASFHTRIEGSNNKKGLVFKGSDILRITESSIFLKELPIFNNSMLDVHWTVQEGEKVYSIDAKSTNLIYAAKGFLKGDKILIEKSYFIGNQCFGEGLNTRFYAYDGNGYNEFTHFLNTIPLIDNKYIELTFFKRTANGNLMWQIAPDTYVANIGNYEIYKLVKEKIPFAQGTPVFVKSAQITGEIKKVLKTSGGIYYYVLLDTGKEYTTRSKNLKLIK